MRMDLVYVLRRSTFWPDYEEFRYSLRSVEKHLRGFGRVIVVGECPGWARNVIHLPADDPFRFNKEANICHKLLVACDSGIVSERFLFINDDHFFLDQVHVDDVPVTEMGALKREEKTTYDKCLNNTARVLSDLGFSTKNFDVHLPTPMTVSSVKEVFNFLPWKKDLISDGLVVKSSWGNVMGIKGEVVEDLKVDQPMTLGQMDQVTSGRWAFSIGDNADRIAKIWIKNEFNMSSKFERTS